MIEMDKTAPIHGNDPHSRSRLCKAFLLTVVMLTGIGVEAQAFAKARGLAQSVRKKTATKQVKSYVCPMHPEVKSTKRSKCPKCKMDLRVEPAVMSSAVTGNQNQIHDNALAEAAGTSAKSTDATDTPNALGFARKMVIPEVEVLDQNGNSLHFYRDLVKGKT